MPMKSQNKISRRTHLIRQLLDHPKEVSDSVIIAGWVQFIRAHGKIMFLTMRDGTGEIQISCKQDLIGHETYTLLETLTLESTLLITGNLKQDHRAPKVNFHRNEKVLLYRAGATCHRCL